MVNTFPLPGPMTRLSFSSFPHISRGNVLASEWSGWFWAKLPKPPSEFLESLDWEWQSHKKAGFGPRKCCLMPAIYFCLHRDWCVCSVTNIPAPSKPRNSVSAHLITIFLLFLPCLCLILSFKLWWLYRKEKSTDSNLPSPTAVFWLRSVWHHLHIGTFIYMPNKQQLSGDKSTWR